MKIRPWRMLPERWRKNAGQATDGGDPGAKESRWRKITTRVMLFAALLALAGTAAIMALDSSRPQYPELPDLEFPPVVAEASRKVSEAEALDMIASMLNLTAWAGETTARAEAGEGFYKALLTGPGIECGKRPEGGTPRLLEEVMRCARAELERRAESVHDWSEIGLEHRAAAVAKGMEQSWWAKSPETMMQVRTAHLRGMMMDREDQGFREFAELFDPCQDEGVRYAGSIARAATEAEAGALYLDAELSMERCTAAVIARRFPKSTGEPEIPPAEPEIPLAEPEILPAEPEIPLEGEEGP